MNSLRRLMTTTAPAAVLLIRIAVGGVFLSEGIQKFLFPNDFGVGRFIKIGIPAPDRISLSESRNHIADNDSSLLCRSDGSGSIDEPGVWTTLRPSRLPNSDLGFLSWCVL